MPEYSWHRARILKIAQVPVQKIAQVPGTEQYNHHFRMLYKEDVNDEMMRFMRMAYEEV